MVGDPTPPDWYTGAARQWVPYPDLRLDREVAGDDAVAALGESLPTVAQAYELTPDALRAALTTDATLRVDRKGLLLFADAPVAGVQEATYGDGLGTNPSPDVIPSASTFLLHSRPGARGTIFLDFRGGTVNSAYWGGGDPIDAPAFSLDADPAFSSADMREIRAVWLQVAEDFAPFDVDVTTEPPVRPDMTRFIRIMVSPTNFYGAAGGVCYVGSFAWGETSMDNQTCWVFSHMLGNSAKNIAEAVSHETGHAFSLYHWGLYNGTERVSSYYSGHGSGATGWAPIMGVGYYQQNVTWSRGEYAGAGTTSSSTKQDDFALIARYAPVRTDEAGASSTAAAMLTGTVTNDMIDVDTRGVLAAGGDYDVYRLDVGAGALSLDVVPAVLAPNADFSARVFTASGAELASGDPAGPGTVALTAMVAAGTYYVEVRSVGYGTATSGYTSYGSAGMYQIKGTYAYGGTAPPPPDDPTPPPPPPADSTPPTVAIVSPINGTTVKWKQTIGIVAGATDEAGLSNISIQVNGNQICSVAVVASTQVTCPYRVTGRAGQQVRITATATDAAGNRATSSTVTVTSVR